MPKDAVPRAELGLPIVFHFKDRGDPPDTQLCPIVGDEACQRMASCLVLKPLAFSRNQAVPLILRLKSPAAQGAVLMDEHGRELRRFGPDAIRNKRFKTYPNSPMRGHSNALDAFLAYAKSRGFQEITL